MKAAVALLCGLLPAAAMGGPPASAELATLPPLPAAVAPDLDCSAGRELGARLEQRLQEAMLRPVAAGAAAGNAQARAIEAMSDPAFSTCVLEFQQQPAEIWIGPLAEDLADRIYALREAKRAADDAYCKAQKAKTCLGDPTAAARFTPEAVTAASAFLHDAQPVYAKYVGDLRACLALREKAIAAGAGLTGTVGTMLKEAEQMNLGLAGLAAGARNRLCDEARQAARTFQQE